jgi:predicted enzyme related to lactoylglutathione lyase
MSTPHGQFVWCELMTTDTASATEFYRAVIGWSASVKDSGLPGQDYTILSAGETPVGGLMALPEAARDAGARPGWIGYIGVDDVDAIVARIKAKGGAIHRPPDDIPGVGRFAVAADPHGAIFTVFKPSCPEAAPPAPGATPGRVGWHELHAGDPEADFAFYADLFGWKKTEAIDMGPMGVYQTFATDAAMVGGVMATTDAMPAPSWLYYFSVDDINAAVTRVKAAGGKVIDGPHQVPGGSWIARGLDKQGATFAMVGPSRAQTE